MSGSGIADAPSGTTYLRVVRGQPTAAELAALVAVLAARFAALSTVDRRPLSAWADPARRVRAPLRPGPGAWRRSALP